MRSGWPTDLNLTTFSRMTTAPARTLLRRMLFTGVTLAAVAPGSARALPLPLPDSGSLVIRVNQLGYLPGDHKVAVMCALQAPAAPVHTFDVRDASGHTVLANRPALASG